MTAPISPQRFDTGPALLLAGLRRHHPYGEAQRSIPEQWQAFKALLPLPGQMGSITYGATCGHTDSDFEYMTGAEVSTFDGLPPTLGRMRIQPREYAVFLHTGPIQGIADTWAAILHGWLPTCGFTEAHAPCFERYDGRYDPSTASGKVEIWIPIERP